MAKAKKKYTITSVNVSFAGKIPTQKFGNIDVQMSYSADVEPDADADEVAQELFGRIRQEVTRAVMPIAKAKMTTAMTQMEQTLPRKDVEEIMGNFGAFAWLQAVAPETAFASLDQLKTAIDTLNQIKGADSLETAQALTNTYLQSVKGGGK